MGTPDLIFGQDIAKAVLLDAGEADSLTGRYGEDVKRYVLQGYWSFLCHARWPWALSPTPGIMTTVAKRDVIVSSISSATPAVVTLSAVIATSMAGRKFYMEGNQSVYRIAGHLAGTNLLTLDAGYVETETAGSAVIFQDEYNLPNACIKVWDPLHVRGQRYNPVPLIEKPEFEARYGRGSWSLGFGPIEAACEIQPDAYSASANGVVRRVRVAPWSEEALNLEFDYTLFHSLDFTGAGDGDTPHCPRERRMVLVHLAVFEMFVNKDDTKADQAITKARQLLEEMVPFYIPSQRGRFRTAPKHSATLGCT